MLPEIDVLLVVGPRNSSSACRLVGVARDGGVPACLVNDARDLDESWLEDVETIGPTSGASTPGSLVRRVLVWLRELADVEVEQRGDSSEGVPFELPPVVRGARGGDA
jgi:4-hydroxy-3-methylbut-2-enyl diphosphate reductase